MSELKAEKLSKRFKNKVILKNFNFELHNGVVGLLGKNGAGKTTLMKIIATLLKPDHGNIIIDKISVKDIKKIKSMIGYLPQDFQFYSNMKVEDVLIYLGLLSKLSMPVVEVEIDNLLTKLNLQEYRYYKIRQLSGGLKQRVGIAQALLNDPKVLILDEPTVGLDPEERDNVRKLISKLGKKRIVLFSTHIVEDIALISDQLLIIDQGRLIFNGNTDNFTHSRKDLELEYLKLINRRE